MADMSETEVVRGKQRWSAGEEGGRVNNKGGCRWLASRGKGGEAWGAGGGGRGMNTAVEHTRGLGGGGGKLLVLLNATAILTYSG